MAEQDAPPAARRAALALLLILLPAAVALAASPLRVGLVLAAFLLGAFHFRCLRAFASILAAALAVSLLTYAPSGLYDVENYLAPQTWRLVAELPAGDYSPLHCCLPDLLARYGAALYRLTGSIDLATSVLWLWGAAAWLTLRESLSPLRCALLLCAPLTLLSLGNLMADGALYALLLAALFCAAAPTPEASPRRNAIALAALACACATKPTAWLPAALIGCALLVRTPRLWPKALLAAAATALYVLPTLRLIAAGDLARISSDFLSFANQDAREMGYLARALYVYLGHWTSARSPFFGIHTLGADGASADALGPLLRLTLWSGALLWLCCRKELRAWARLWGLCLLSLLLLPPLYLGYARYVPLLYPAAMLPWVLRKPRWALVPCLALAAVPLLFLGWRAILASEALIVANHATAVESLYANSGQLFRAHRSAERQPTRSANLFYTYTLDDPARFPPAARTYHDHLSALSATAKAAEVAPYALHRWLPWALRSAPRLLGEVLRLRLRNFQTRLAQE